MLRFILVNDAHLVIKNSEKMRKKYLSIVRRLTKNHAIVAIARILLEAIYVMLSRGTKFVDGIESLTEKKMNAMSARAGNATRTVDLENAIKSIRGKRLKGMLRELFFIEGPQSYI